MKIIIGNYRNHWLSPYVILEKFFYWRKDYDAYKNEPPKWLQTLCEWNQKLLDTVHPRINYIKIDPWDTWSTPETLGTIILPMLKQIKENKYGAPFVDDCYVPDELKSMNAPRCENEWDVDDNYFKRWEYVLDEIIWSFEQLYIEWEDQYKSGESNWIEVESDFEYEGEKCIEMKHGPNHTQKYDWDGMKTHNDRIQNGFMLFGFFYRNLWE